MKEWKTRPTDIALWENEIQYILFVDENNGDNVAQIAKKLKQKKEIRPDERFLTLTGCIIEKKHYEQLKEEFEFIKYKYWTDAKYFHEKNQVERNVCFHSREIRNKMNAFNMEDEKYQEFIQDLSKKIKNAVCDAQKKGLLLQLFFLLCVLVNGVFQCYTEMEICAVFCVRTRSGKRKGRRKQNGRLPCFAGR